jgi:hypothetical protein
MVHSSSVHVRGNVSPRMFGPLSEKPKSFRIALVKAALGALRSLRQATPRRFGHHRRDTTACRPHAGSIFMSATLATSAPDQPSSDVTASATAGRRRDHRLDFARGLALLMIFVDHVSGNRFAALTLQSMGFADAAEVFVFIAGMAAVLAYRKAFAEGWRIGSMAVLARMKTLYLAHLGMAAGILVLATVAVTAGTGFDIMTKLGLEPLLADPVQALLRLPVLGYLPHYLDILPLYVALFAALPIIFAAMRVNAALPLAIAGVFWVAAQYTGMNLPNLGMETGWFLNPFAWLLLFTLGATAAELIRSGFFARMPRIAHLTITAAAAAYVVFAFLYAAPWRIFPALNAFVAFEFTLHADKHNLSWHRLADIAAKAWLLSVLVAPAASFMTSGIGSAITRAGRNSLPLFIVGAYLSMLGSIALFEADGHALAHIGVTFGGVAALLILAFWLEPGARQPTTLKVSPSPVAQPSRR